MLVLSIVTCDSIIAAGAAVEQPRGTLTMAIHDVLYRQGYDEPTVNAVQAIDDWAADQGFDDTTGKVLRAYSTYDDPYGDPDDNVIDSLLGLLNTTRIPTHKMLVCAGDAENRQWVYMLVDRHEVLPPVN